MTSLRGARIVAAFGCAMSLAVLVPAAHAATQLSASSTASASASTKAPTGWSALNTAIAKIPTYHPGDARWVVSSRYAYWGTADWYHDVLYVDPAVPTARLYDVAVHEWSHELSVLDYGGDVRKATHAMNRYFGGTGLVGAERAADCMAIEQGAVWTHYTTCRNVDWRRGARRLVNGRRLPT
jgi:hypothetical protein